MSKADYRRPADYQINHIWQCCNCKREVEMQSIYAVGACSCGGQMMQVGETYPASSDDWDEERDSVNGDWHRRRD